MKFTENFSQLFWHMVLQSVNTVTDYVCHEFLNNQWKNRGSESKVWKSLSASAKHHCQEGIMGERNFIVFSYPPFWKWPLKCTDWCWVRGEFSLLFHRIIRATQFPWIHALLIAQIHENISFLYNIVWFNKLSPIWLNLLRCWQECVLRCWHDLKSVIYVLTVLRCWLVECYRLALFAVKLLCL